MYTLNSSDKGRSISVFENGKLYVADDSHPNFDDIVEGVFSGDDVGDLFDVTVKVATKFDKLSERVSVANGNIYFDNEVVDSALSSQVLKFLQQGLDFKPLVRFWENIAQNTNEHSRQQSYRWLNAHDFTIDSGGYILAYKGVQPTNGELTEFQSISSGTAISDGVVHTGQIPQKIGSVVEMDRSKVAFDPGVGCSTGLHAGTWDYARGFARGAVLTVRIHPRDIVSVPTDCADAKMRVSRYSVVGVTEVELPVYVADETYDDYDEDWDETLDDGLEEDWEEVTVESNRAGESQTVSNSWNRHANGNSTEELSRRAKVQTRDELGRFFKKN